MITLYALAGFGTIGAWVFMMLQYIKSDEEIQKQYKRIEGLVGAKTAKFCMGLSILVGALFVGPTWPIYVIW